MLFHCFTDTFVQQPFKIYYTSTKCLDEVRCTENKITSVLVRQEKNTNNPKRIEAIRSILQ